VTGTKYAGLHTQWRGSSLIQTLTSNRMLTNYTKKLRKVVTSCSETASTLSLLSWKQRRCPTVTETPRYAPYHLKIILS